MRITGSPYQNVQYLLEKTLAQNAVAEKPTTEQGANSLRHQLNANTWVEKTGDKVVIYRQSPDGNKRVLQQMSADSRQGQRLLQQLKLTGEQGEEQEASSPALAALEEFQQSKPKLGLVDYLA